MLRIVLGGIFENRAPPLPSPRPHTQKKGKYNIEKNKNQNVPFGAPETGFQAGDGSTPASDRAWARINDDVINSMGCFALDPAGSSTSIKLLPRNLLALGSVLLSEVHMYMCIHTDTYAHR